jgi:hypothetical protein
MITFTNTPPNPHAPPDVVIKKSYREPYEHEGVLPSSPPTSAIEEAEWLCRAWNRTAYVLNKKLKKRSVSQLEFGRILAGVLTEVPERTADQILKAILQPQWLGVLVPPPGGEPRIELPYGRPIVLTLEAFDPVEDEEGRRAAEERMRRQDPDGGNPS